MSCHAAVDPYPIPAPHMPAVNATHPVSITLTHRLWCALGSGMVVGEMEYGLDETKPPYAELAAAIAPLLREERNSCVADALAEIALTVPMGAVAELYSLWADADYESFLPRPFTPREVTLAEAAIAHVPPRLVADRRELEFPREWRPTLQGSTAPRAPTRFRRGR